MGTPDIDPGEAERVRQEALARGLRAAKALEARYPPEPGRLLGARGGWELRVWDDGHQPWRNWRRFVVVSTRRSTRKSKFRGAWNGRHISRTRDMAALLERHPEVHAWVATTVPATMKEDGDV
jgi:hypothetical protein